MGLSLLDFEQVIKNASDDANGAIRVTTQTGLIKAPYDYVALTYVPSGNGAGQIQTVTFKTGGSGGSTVGTLTLAYDSGNNLVSVTLS